MNKLFHFTDLNVYKNVACRKYTSGFISKIVIAANYTCAFLIILALIVLYIYKGHFLILSKLCYDYELKQTILKNTQNFSNAFHSKNFCVFFQNCCV